MYFRLNKKFYIKKADPSFENKLSKSSYEIFYLICYSKWNKTLSSPRIISGVPKLIKFKFDIFCTKIKIL